jgi:hypothetical protein
MNVNNTKSQHNTENYKDNQTRNPTKNRDLNPGAHKGYPVSASSNTTTVLFICDLFHVLEDSALVNTLKKLLICVLN